MCQPCRNKKRIYGTYFVPDQYFNIDDPKFQEDGGLQLEYEPTHLILIAVGQVGTWISNP